LARVLGTKLKSLNKRRSRIKRTINIQNSIPRGENVLAILAFLRKIMVRNRMPKVIEKGCESKLFGIGDTYGKKENTIKIIPINFVIICT
jgi:hypothetical protein